MSLQYDTRKEMGQIEMPAKDGGYCDCKILGGNALAIIVTEVDNWCYLAGFFGDEEHLYRCLGLKEGYTQDLYDGSKNIRLNTYYKESITLLKAFNKAGHEVTTYYEKPTE